MKFPLQSPYKQTEITLDITAKEPIEVGLSVVNPLRPYSAYLRRKADLRQRSSRQLKVLLPSTPKQLEIQLTDKTHGNDKHIQLEDIKVRPMKEPTIWATAERHRFMKFAIDFATKCGAMPTGYYHAPQHEFLIQYLPKITDHFGVEQVTPARVHRQMPRIQVSKKHFLRYSIPVRVAILSHEACHYFLNTRSEKEADLCGIKHYLDYGFPKIEAVYAVTKVFGEHPDNLGKPHLQRVEDIVQFIHHYQPLT